MPFLTLQSSFELISLFTLRRFTFILTVLINIRILCQKEHALLTNRESMKESNNVKYLSHQMFRFHHLVHFQCSLEIFESQCTSILMIMYEV